MDLIFQDTKILKENSALEFSLLFGIAVTSVEKIHDQAYWVWLGWN